MGEQLRKHRGQIGTAVGGRFARRPRSSSGRLVPLALPSSCANNDARSVAAVSAGLAWTQGGLTRLDCPLESPISSASRTWSCRCRCPRFARRPARFRSAACLTAAVIVAAESPFAGARGLRRAGRTLQGRQQWILCVAGRCRRLSPSESPPPADCAPPAASRVMVVVMALDSGKLLGIDAVGLERLLHRVLDRLNQIGRSARWSEIA